MIDLNDLEKPMLESAVEKIEETTFDVFTFNAIMQDNSLVFIQYLIYRHYDFFKNFSINISTLTHFTKEI